MKRYYILFFCLCYCTPMAFAQPEQLSGLVSYVPNNNGQPTQIQVLLKNHVGLLFAGTTAGVFKFTGSSFKPVLFKDSIITGKVTALFEDRNKKIWAGFASGAIATGTSHFLQRYNPEEGTPAKAITHFTEDPGGQIWFATNGEGIYYTHKGRLYNIDSADGLSDPHVHQLAATSTGEILAATDQGLNICRANGSHKSITALNTANGLPDNLITCLLPVGNDRFWVGMQDKGYCLYDHRTKQFSLQSKAWPYGQINALLATPSGQLWIATAEQGLLRQLPGSPQPPQPLYKGLHGALGLLADNEGNYWINEGTHLLRSNGEKLRALPLLSQKLLPAVHAILVSRDNYCWVGTDMALLRYHLDDLSAPPLRYPIPELSRQTAITSLYEDQDGNIWIGTMGKGAFILNPRSRNYRPLTDNPMLINSSIFSITGRDKIICISGLEGAAVLTPGSSGYNYTNYNSIPGIGNSIVYSMYKDSRNRLWFATDGKGITMLDKGVFTNYDERSGLKDKVVYAITEDRQGQLWLSTAKAGIYRFDGNRFSNYSTAQGLSSTTISDIKTDGAGNIIVVGKKGLDIINPQTGQFSYLGSSQGISEVNTADIGCVAGDGAGNVFFCTTEGLYRYSPVPGGIAAPNVIIESVRLALEDLEAGADSIFSHDQNNLSFEFIGLGYSDPDRLQYQYRLDGYDTSWVSTRDGKAQFARLQPGNYRFRVRAALNNNFSTAGEAVFAFVIERPVWQRWWFMLLSLLAIAALLYWYIRVRERRLRKLQQHEQEKVQFKFEVLRNQVNPHFLFNSFNTLISTIEEDPRKAVEYTEQLSDFFRNIVNYRDKELVTLKEELQLLENYTFLQQKRYGNSLQLTMPLSETIQTQGWIPPLTLQLLAENAVKHNALSVETPLLIEIFADGEYLIVRNNLNPRLTRQEGTGMGLSNIINRYSLLSKKPVHVKKEDRFFTVSLPIIKRNA
jgi:ligand-binding sensor domain-containing protein/uncharacterized membrane-anchored protein YhcB (DUF1043 family)